ncbi:hypothetical protein CJ483_19730 [Bacillus sp. PK3_68]|nr:hypothetical protein CJ483_19730 [Bacillus sp. PK3_68]
MSSVFGCTVNSGGDRRKLINGIDFHKAMLMIVDIFMESLIIRGDLKRKGLTVAGERTAHHTVDLKSFIREDSETLKCKRSTIKQQLDEPHFQ